MAILATTSQTFAQAREDCLTAAQADNPVLLIGAPGIGKSALARELATRLKLPLIDLRITYMEPPDMLGLYDTRDGRTVRCPPDWVPTKEPALVFLDELTAAPMAMQVACYQVLLDRRIGDACLAPGSYIMAAGNRIEDRAAAQRMSTALNNRVSHIEMRADPEQWLSEFFWAHPLVSTCPEVIAVGQFLEWQRQSLHVFDPNSKEAAFPSPRTWEMVMRILATDRPRDSKDRAIRQTIGQGVGGMFVSFRDMMHDIPSIDQILNDPGRAPIPDNMSARMATCASLAQVAKHNNVDAIFRYLDRMDREAQFFTARLMPRFCDGIVRTHAYAKWQGANHEFVMAQ